MFNLRSSDYLIYRYMYLHIYITSARVNKAIIVDTRFRPHCCPWWLTFRTRPISVACKHAVVHKTGLLHGTDHCCIVVRGGLSDDTIRDAILTCNQKLTWVRLIYCAEPATRKWKQKKEKRICSEVSVNSKRNAWRQVLKKKKSNAADGGICRKGRF